MIRMLALGLALFATPAIAADLAITDVTVVDTRTGALAPHRTVVVHDGRIASVGTGPAPRGATVVRGAGRFLIPGLTASITSLVGSSAASNTPTPTQQWK